MQKTVLIAGLSLNGATAVRHLSLLGYEVWALSYHREEPGWYSRHGRKVLVPNPYDDFDGWLVFMLDFARQFEQPPLVLPMSDVFVVALDRAAREAEWRYLAHSFGTGLRTSLTSKRETFQLAEKFDFPRPKTRFVQSRDELAAFAQSIGSDVLIKPEFPAQWRHGSAAKVVGKRKVIAGEHLDELLLAYDTISPYTPGVLAQEVIPGPDKNLLYWCGFMGPNGRAGGRLVGRKLRVLPIHFGSASFVTLVDRPEVEQQCVDFLAALSYQGICGVELKEDPRDGVAKLIEVNPRCGLWDDIGIPVGVDLLREAIECLGGHVVVPKRASHFRMKWVSVIRDVAALPAYRREGHLSIWAWLRSLTPPIRVNDVPLFDDPRYAFRVATRGVAKLTSKLLRRI